jgi:hypothetical protein
LIVPEFLSHSQTSSLLSRAKELLDEFTPEDHPLVSAPFKLQTFRTLDSWQIKFTTSDEDHIGDNYFLNSGDKIRYFLDEDAVDSSGKLTRDKARAVNKIGHGSLPIHTNIHINLT